MPSFAADRARPGRRPLSIAGLLLALNAAGCGGQAILSPVPDPTLAACVPGGAAVSMPDRLIEVFPLPDGTRVTTAKLVGVGPLVVAGYVPGDVPEASGFFHRELVRSGFVLSDGHASDTRAGSSLEGQGLEGRWEVAGLADCPGTVSLTVSVSER